jgi:hypothetical protein
MRDEILRVFAILQLSIFHLPASCIKCKHLNIVLKTPLLRFLRNFGLTPQRKETTCRIGLERKIAMKCAVIV